MSMTPTPRSRASNVPANRRSIFPVNRGSTCLRELGISLSLSVEYRTIYSNRKALQKTFGYLHSAERCLPLPRFPLSFNVPHTPPFPQLPRHTPISRSSFHPPRSPPRPSLTAPSPSPQPSYPQPGAPLSVLSPAAGAQPPVPKQSRTLYGSPTPPPAQPAYRR